MWHCSTFQFDDRIPIVMGILNLTPDSFSDGGAYNTFDQAYAHAHEMLNQGADIIDIGGESTRPGSNEVPEQEELERVIEMVSKLSSEGHCVSIDTRHASVASEAVAAGASIINDISGFKDPKMVEIAKQSDVGLVVMHMQGEPKNMQDNPEYDDVVVDVQNWLEKQAKYLESQGIEANRICIDPGPGFGKTYSQTTDIVRNYHEFARLGYPLMCAISRKSFLGAMYNLENPSARDLVSANKALAACEMGATIIRTHNVEKTREALKGFRPLVVVGLGCNIALVGNEGEEREGKIAQLNQAISQLCTVPDSQIVDISSFYTSQPAYFEDQEEFLNAIVLMRSGVPPLELLKYFHAIEGSLGRTRDVKNGPRTCDLDIVDYQMYSIANETLTLPHTGALERDFVIKPLKELRPNFVFANEIPISKAKPEYGKAERIS